MFATRTKQVHSYGRRGSRIVDVSDRRNQNSANSSETPSDVGILPPRPLKRENTIVISPAKPRVGLRRLKGSSHCTRGFPLVHSRSVQPKAIQDAVTKRTHSKRDSNARVRQPLTPLRSDNGSSSNNVPSPGVKGKSKASSIKYARTSLKQHSPVVAVDILLFDEAGNVLTQERRLSHTEIQTNQLPTAAGKGKGVPKMLKPSASSVLISDDSGPEDAFPEPVVEQRNRNPRAIVISSDESEYEENTVCKKSLIPLAKSHARPKSSRVGVVMPPASYQKPKFAQNPPSPSPLALTPLKHPVLPTPSSRFAAFIPIAKPRQLTPIRGSSSRSVLHLSLPTPSTPTEADLSLDLAQLDLFDVVETDNLTYTQPEYLVPLLNECAQISPYEFSAFIETFPFDPVVQSSAEDGDARFRKIGEASYSEVFGIGDVVLKIIPVRLEESMHLEMDEIPAPSDAKDVLKEIIVTREIGGICDKFVKLLKSYVVRGKYPSLLLDLWDEYNERKGSESMRPDSFGLAQVYAIIILPNAGLDLELFAFKNISKSGWHQACGIFWQVARALEQAERSVNFEHRDLHWGQILVTSIPVKKSTHKRSMLRVAMDDARFGVKVTIIDLGLSRMDATDAQGSMTYWTPLDDEIFEGEGDYQYDIYRMMRDLTGGAWQSYHSFTNVMWLHYLVTKLLHEKHLKLLVDKRQTGRDTRAESPTGYDELECYECLAEVEEVLGNTIASVRKGQKRRRKTVAPSSGPRSAGDVISYGVQRGWVR